MDHTFIMGCEHSLQESPSLISVKVLFNFSNRQCSYSKKFTDSQEGTIWLPTRCKSQNSIGWTTWYRFFCNFRSSLSRGGTMKRMSGQVWNKKISLYHFTKVSEWGWPASVSVFLHNVLEYTAFYTFCYAIFTSLFKMENDSNFAFMLRFLQKPGCYSSTFIEESQYFKVFI